LERRKKGVFGRNSRVRWPSEKRAERNPWEVKKIRKGLRWGGPPRLPEDELRLRKMIPGEKTWGSQRAPTLSDGIGEEHGRKEGPRKARKRLARGGR